MGNPMRNINAEKLISIILIYIFISACAGQMIDRATPIQTVSKSKIPETVTPEPTPTLTVLPVKPIVTVIPSPRPATQPSTPVQEIHAQINWQLKAQFMIQAISFISLQQGWAAADDTLSQTKDGGQTWQKISNTPEPFSRLDFVSETHGWGMGKEWLYVSKDGGLTWERQLQKSFDTSRGIWKPDFDFIDDQVGWLTINEEVLKTEDSGQTWQTVNVPLPNKLPDPVYSLSFITPEIGWLLQAFCNMPACSLNFYKTQDGGVSWQAVVQDGSKNPDGQMSWMRPPDEIFFLDGQHAWFVGSMGSDYVSADGGRTWKPNAFLGGAGPSLHQIHMFSPLQGVADYWMGGFYAVVRTDDGGKTWEQIFPSIYPITNFQFFNTQNGFGLDTSVNGTILLTTKDGGETWQKARDLPCVTQFLNENNGWGVCNFNPSDRYSGLLYHTSDGGANWQKIATPDTLVTVNFQFMDDQTGVVWDLWDHLYGTQDGGKTWEPIHVTQGKFPLKEDQAGWLMENDKTIYHANKSDSTWVPVLSFGAINQFDPVSANVAFLSDKYYGELLKTSDGGKTWTRIVFGDEIDNNFYHFHFVDEQQGWLASNKGLFSTNDGGQTWDQIQPQVGY